MSKRDLEQMRADLKRQIQEDLERLAVSYAEHLDGRAGGVMGVLSSPQTADEIIRDLAREELEDTVQGGFIPSGALIRLAGYEPNSAHAA